MPSQSSCPVCQGQDARRFFELAQQPVLVGTLYTTREAARSCRRGDLALVYCPDCGFIYNQRFDPESLQYSQAYDNSLHFSPLYQEYAQATARTLVERYGIQGKTVLEIGCGKGDFLLLLCQLGRNRGVGFDQSYEARALAPELAERLTLINDLYGPAYADYQGDLICSRYVLEHIPNPLEFLQMLRATITDPARPLLYFEVPNVRLILSALSVWDIIYEHYAYFSLASLTHLFQAAGFRVLQRRETFSGQFISVEACLATEAPDRSVGHQRELDDLSGEVDRFPLNYQEMLDRWQDLVQTAASGGRRVVLWGGGAKGVSFLNLVPAGREIEYVVDINPGKQGRFIAGSGQLIVPPAFLREYRPEAVIILNPAYRAEIQTMLDQLGLAPELLCP